MDRPYCLNLSRVHSLALVRSGEPVSRGPIMSQRYSMLAISSDRLSISSRIAWVTALVSPLAAGTVETPLRCRACPWLMSEEQSWAHTAAGVVKTNTMRADCLMILMIRPISTDV